MITSSPYPIVLPLELLHGKVDSEARAKSLLVVFTDLLTYQPMIVQSEYLRSHFVDEELTTISRPIGATKAPFPIRSEQNRRKSKKMFRFQVTPTTFPVACSIRHTPI